MKITSVFLTKYIERFGDASYALTLKNLVKILERNGYVLVEVYRSRSRKVYYFRPPESVCAQVMKESRAKVSKVTSITA